MSWIYLLYSAVQFSSKLCPLQHSHSFLRNRPHHPISALLLNLTQRKGKIFSRCARSRVQNWKWGLPLEHFDKWYGLEWLGCEAGAGSTPATLSIFGQRERALAKWARRRQSYHLCFPPVASWPCTKAGVATRDVSIEASLTGCVCLFTVAALTSAGSLAFLVVTSHLTLRLFWRRRVLFQCSFS